MSVSAIILAVLMAGALAGLIACVKKAKSPNGEKRTGLSVVLFLAILICGAGFLYEAGLLRNLGLDFGYGKKILSADAVIYGSQADLLAPLLKQGNFAKILLIVNGDFESSHEYFAFVTRLQAQGIAPEALVTENLAGTGPKTADGSKMPMQPVRITAVMLEKAAASHPECKAVITMAGLPVMETAAMNCVKQPASPNAQKWIILEPVGELAAVKQGLRHGNILAACAFADHPVGEIASLPSAPEKIFALRYQLITGN